MSQIYPLDPVIRRVDCSKPPILSSPSEKLVIIDAKTGEILPRRPLMSFRELRCYLVAAQKYAECEVLDCKVKDIATGRAISIDIIYEASCESGKEENLVKALFTGVHPGAVVEQFIRQCLQDFVRLNKNNGINFIDGYFQGLKEKAPEHISQRANREIDLSLELRLSLKDANKIKPLQIHSQFFPVRVKDYGEELSLKIAEAMLQVNEDNKIYIVATNEQESQLQQLLQQKIGVFLRENVTLHEFVYQLNGQLRDKLVTYLNDNVLLNRGRKISYIALDSSDIGSLRPEESSLFKYEIECSIKDCPEPIRVEHEVLMNLTDIGKYQATRIDDLKDWLSKKVEKITQTMLLKMQYADLILDFDKKSDDPKKIENQIKAKVKQEANSIGYDIEHLFIIPNLEPITLKRDGIFLEEEGEFVTKDTRVKGRLKIVVKAEVNNLEGLRDYLSPHKSVLNEIKRVIFEQAQLLIHDMEPERFYMRFSGHDPAQEQISVEQLLKEEITQKLKNTFSLSELTVTPKADQENDVLAKRFNALQESFHDFQFETSPIREGGNEESVTFTGKFKVWTVCDWHTFQINNYKLLDKEITDIQEVLQEDIKATLEIVPSHLIRYRDQKTKTEVLKTFNYSLKRTAKQFGLIVEIVNIKRSLTQSEQLAVTVRDDHHHRASERLKIENQMAEKTNQADLQKLEVLHQQEQELIATALEDDDPTLESVRKRIEELRGKNPTYSIGSEIRPQLASLKSERPSDEDFNFDDFHQELQVQTLPSEQPAKRLEKDTKEENQALGVEMLSITRYPNATFITQVRVSEVKSLRVAVTREPKKPEFKEHAMILSVPEGKDYVKLDVMVSAEGFDILDDDCQTLIVPVDRDSNPVLFKLRAIMPGKRKINIEFFQAGRYAGSLNICSQVIEHATQPIESSQVNVQGETIVYDQPAVPDLTLSIIADELKPGQFTYSFTVHSEKSEVDLWHRRINQKMLPLCEPSSWASQQFQELKNLHRNQNHEHVQRTLETIGTNLYETLFPAELKQLWSERIRGKVKSIQIVSDEPWIPWELIRPSYTDTDGITQEDGFLCEDYLVGRWLAGSPPPVQIKPKRGTVIIPKDSGLKYAKQEAKALESLGVNIDTTAPSLYAVRNLLEKGAYELIHFACHAQFQSSQHEQSTIVLENKEKFFTREITGKQRNFGKQRPLVFVNACQSARADFTLAGIGGWAEKFVRARSSAFIGTAWSVNDAAAYHFAKAFYHALRDGQNLGEAVRQARSQAKKIPGSASWLSYVLYGDPLATLNIGQKALKAANSLVAVDQNE